MATAAEQQSASARLRRRLEQKNDRDTEYWIALAADYRGTVAELERERRRETDTDLPGVTVLGLERLVQRGRAKLWSGPHGPAALRNFLGRGYWREIALRRRPITLAAITFLGGVLFAFVWGLVDPDSVRTLVPANFIDGADPPRGDRGMTPAQSAAFSASLFTNNIRVTLLAFALGIAWGVFGAALLAFNGVIFGAVLGIAAVNHNLVAVLMLVCAHGLLELSCIIVAGGAGMWMGWGVVRPAAHRTRTTELALRARPAMRIVLGTAPWLVVAGIIEAFVSPAGLPSVAVAIVGFGLFACFWGLVATRGRQPSHHIR